MAAVSPASASGPTLTTSPSRARCSPGAPDGIGLRRHPAPQPPAASGAVIRRNRCAAPFDTVPERVNQSPPAAALPPLARRVADMLLVVTVAALPLSTTAMEAGLLALAALTLFGVFARWSVVCRTPLDAALAILGTTFVVSTLASGHPFEASGWLGRWVVLAYFLTYWWLRDARHAVRLVHVLVGAGALAAVYGILQHFTGADWYRSLLGRPTFVHPRNAGSQGYAVVGFFRNYLTYAHAMLFPLAWAAALAVRGSVAGIVAAPLLVVAIVFSTARGAWLAALAGGTILAMVARRRATLLMLGALAAAACLAFALAPDLRRQATEMFATTGENAARIEIYRANLDIVHERPIFGVGFGRYQRAAPPYYVAHPEADRHSHAHNDYLQIAAEAGLVGLAAFSLLYATALRKGWAAIRRAATPEVWAVAVGAWIATWAFLVGGLTQYNFGDSEVAIPMWLALAVLMRCAA